MFGIGKKIKQLRLRLQQSVDNKRKSVDIKRGVIIGRTTSFEDHIRIRENTRIEGHVGRCTYISQNCNIFGDIGRFCSIGSGVTTLMGRHPLDSHVSTSPATYSAYKQCGISYHHDPKFQEIVYAKGAAQVVIENDVWLGPNVMIVSGVTIHNGAVALAGAVVTKDVPPYAVVGGVPARILKYRFPEAQIAALQELKWWDKDDCWLEKYAPFMDDVNVFLEKVKGVG